MPWKFADKRIHCCADGMAPHIMSGNELAYKTNFAAQLSY